VRLAREVQEGLLPAPGLLLPEVEVAGRFLPCWALGGDFYDYFPLGERVLGLYLGDVQGKGLGGALDALLVSGLLRGVHKAGARPADVLAFLNRRLSLRSGPGRFACLGYALYDRAARRLQFANAGLPFPWLVRGGRLEPIRLTGPPVGLFDSSEFDQTEVALAPGDRLLFYTDGVTDSLRGPRSRQPEGEERLAELVLGAAGSSAAALADALVRRLRRRRRAARDDMSFIVLRIR